ncbi:MAG: FAD-binding oxidoreductase [Actinomycetota bacterium]
MSTTSSTKASSLLRQLSEKLNGRLILPDHQDYDRARTVFPGGIDRRPAAIARVANEDDVARVITFAADTGLELAVRSGGHSPAGHGVCDGGIVLDVSQMKHLDIDVGGETVWAQSGLTAAEYTSATSAHGLVTGFGDTGSVGIGGITLAGGIGYLVRKFGLTIDDLLATEVVTADGRVVMADAETNPDLFWALRGGGGNFGVATRFRYRLHRLPTVVGGFLMLPATPETISSFLEAAEVAPEELSTIANVMPAPPMPFVPAEHHGRLVIFGMLCFAGNPTEGEAAVAPFRALARPLVDMVQEMPYPQIYPPDEEDYHPVAASRTMFVDEINRRSIETMVDDIQASTASMAVAQIRVLGGAMARVPTAATAFAHRQRRMMLNVAALYEQPAQQAEQEAWVSKLSAVLGGDGQGAYVGFLGEDGRERVGEAYPGATWSRLTAVKHRYDPTNLFRHNTNIPPRS